MNRRGLGLALAVALAVAAPGVRSAAQTDEEADVVRWAPPRPKQGTLFRLYVDGVSDPRAVAGTAAGEPLHFDQSGAGRLSALAAVPMSTKGAVAATIVIRDEIGTDTLRVRIPVAPGAYPMERLSVAPEFGGKPDSALQRRIDDEARRANEVARASHDTPRLWAGAFIAPRPGRITSGFGRGRVFNGAVTSRHMGTDFAGPVGAPVRAANRGVVRIVDRFYLGGNVVYLDHGAGLVTAYLHLSQTDVAVGDTVERGQVIGRVGATGRVTGPHLHLIARYGQITVDPLTLLRVTQSSARASDARKPTRRTPTRAAR